MRFRVTSIELDTSIQCRAAIDTAIVNEYAEAMANGDEFPPIELYGTRDKAWPADGWHRILAAKQNGEIHIEASLHDGGRVDALRAALSANSIHGHRRTNLDKRRAVEIALREFGHLSSRAIAEMCGVGYDLVQRARPEAMTESVNATVTTQDGRQYPARRTRSEVSEEPSDTSLRETFRPVVPVVQREAAPPSLGLQFARMAILDLEQIKRDDSERAEAFALVEDWLNANR